MLIDFNVLRQEGILSPFTTFFRVMEQTSKPTCSLVLPIVGKLITVLGKDKKFNVMDYSVGKYPKRKVVQVRTLFDCFKDYFHLRLF